MSYRQSRILLPYLVPRTSSRPFFTLPSAFGGLGVGLNPSGGSDDGMQKYHERKIMPLVRVLYFEATKPRSHNRLVFQLHKETVI